MNQLIKGGVISNQAVSNTNRWEKEKCSLNKELIRNTCMQSIHCDQKFFTPTFITKLEWIMSSCSVFFAFFLFYLLFRLLFALTYTMFLLYALYNAFKGCYYIEIILILRRCMWKKNHPEFFYCICTRDIWENQISHLNDLWIKPIWREIKCDVTISMPL